MKKFINLEKINKLYNCRPCGHRFDGRISIHAEERALKDYIRTKSKRELKKGFSICTMRILKNQHTKEYEFGNSKPCSKCLFMSIRKILKNNNVNPSKINIIYSDSTNIIKIPYTELCKKPYYVSSASRRLNSVNNK